MRKILLIDCSPREGGNCDIIVDNLMRRFECVESIKLRNYSINGCTGCGCCDNLGECVIFDDVARLFADILDREIIVFVAPVYFFGFDGRTKSFIDRAQVMWSQHLDQYKPNRKAYLISVGGQTSLAGFEGMTNTLKCYGITMGAKYTDGIYLANVDNKGDVNPHLERVMTFMNGIIDSYNSINK